MISGLDEMRVCNLGVDMSRCDVVEEARRRVLPHQLRFSSRLVGAASSDHLHISVLPSKQAVKSTM